MENTTVSSLYLNVDQVLGSVGNDGEGGRAHLGLLVWVLRGLLLVHHFDKEWVGVSVGVGVREKESVGKKRMKARYSTSVPASVRPARLSHA